MREKGETVRKARRVVLDLPLAHLSDEIVVLGRVSETKSLGVEVRQRVELLDLIDGPVGLAKKKRKRRSALNLVFFSQILIRRTHDRREDDFEVASEGSIISHSSGGSSVGLVWESKKRRRSDSRLNGRTGKGRTS